MNTRSSLALKCFRIPVAGSVLRALHGKLTTGHWTIPVYFMVPVFAGAAWVFWHNCDPGRVAAREARRAGRTGQ
ncbi:hypothetical protein [Actinacidiphila glaucinigra]|uniref:hypothetical protein n=1 Tax=Actinacidiphila glaucinigra TaxID=235986 RepID=UPI0036EB4C51